MKKTYCYTSHMSKRSVGSKENSVNKMIRKLGILTVLGLCLSASTTADTPDIANNFPLIQKFAFDVLWHVDQPDKVHPEIYKIGTTWDIEANLQLYKNQDAVKEFLALYKYGMLPRGRIFSIFYEKHLEEAVALFELFYAAGDIQTFLNTAAWARVHLNEFLFTYVFRIAISQRPDVENIYLPLPSDLQPNFYFNHDVMQQAYDYKMSRDPHTTEPTPTLHIIPANYTYPYVSNTRDPEIKLNYFCEDVGLNNYYYFLDQEFPFWLAGEKFNKSAVYRGELYLYLHKIFWKRYELERLSNGLPPVESFDWNRPIQTGYKPALAYSSGLQFPQREEWSYVPNDKFVDVEKAMEYESRIKIAIDTGRFLTPDGETDSIYDQKGLDMLGNAIAGSADSPHRNFYGSIDNIARNIFSFNPKPYDNHKVVPSALEHFSTSMRDPAFYRIFARITNLLHRYKSRFIPYTREELEVKGVEIESVAVDKLVTYFEYSDSLISNAVKVHDHQDAESFLIKARQYRLTHKPFTYHFTIKSDKKVKIIIRIFLGPKYDYHGNEIDFSENYNNFYQFEYFIVELDIGTNKIERNSTESTFMGPDYVGSDIYYKKIVDAIANGSELPVINRPYAFPERLLFPKGTPQGFPIQLFFYASEYHEDSSVDMNSRILGKWYYDTKPFGFPVDRPVLINTFNTSNMLFKTAYVFHEDEVNANLNA